MSRLEQTADSEWVDEDGYPTDAALERVKTWPFTDLPGLFAFLRSIWWAADWGWHEEVTETQGVPVRRFHVSTGGWSGNEDIIDTFEHNFLCWSQSWVSVRRGGHYVFEVEQAQATKEPADEAQVLPKGGQA